MFDFETTIEMLLQRKYDVDQTNIFTVQLTRLFASTI